MSVYSTLHRYAIGAHSITSTQNSEYRTPAPVRRHATERQPTGSQLAIAALAILATVLSTLTATQPLLAADAVEPGAVSIDATFDHLGVRWEIDGDDDLDSTMRLEFRRAGGSWRDAALPMRAHPTLIVDGQPLEMNYWAASALFLEPDTTYDLRVTLEDPDGGSETRILSGSLRPQPALSPNTNVRYVTPGSGGGNGTPNDPFRGLQAAADAAAAGDLFLLQPGTYSPFELLSSGAPGQPITFRGDSATTVIDGSGTDRGIITLGVFDEAISYIVLEELIIRDGAWGIDAQNTQELVVRNNLVEDVDFGINNRRELGAELNQTICDNSFIGRLSWPGSGIPGERGINISGTGNVVCFNRVSNFGDCMTIANEARQADTFGNDVFGNDVAFCIDDGIEMDYNTSNTRVWRNRVMNARTGVSTQPILGGPAYIFRNEFFNIENAPVKMNNQPTGLVVVHNTGAKHVNGMEDSSEPWRNAVYRNNLYLGTRYAFEFLSTADDGPRDFDYNAWGTTREIGGPGEPYFKWDDVRYQRLADLPSGVEDHGVEATFEDLIDAELTDAYEIAADPGSRDLRLQAGAPEIDAGQPLANLNDTFPLQGPPDIGAFEFGQPLPTYGPRDAPPVDLEVTGSCPGALIVEVSGGSSNGAIGFLTGTALGDDTINRRCIGLATGLASPRLLASAQLDGSGARTLTVNAPASACGSPLQVLDAESCRLTPTVSLP